MPSPPDRPPRIANDPIAEHIASLVAGAARFTPSDIAELSPNMALVFAAMDADGGMRREVMVRFLDGTVRLCRVEQWRRSGDGWWCLLRWGVSGRLMEGWYLSDPALMEPLREP